MVYGSNHSDGGSSINGGTRIISAKKKARAMRAMKVSV
jgi:hypothetical protein